MYSKLVYANISRWIARTGSIVVILIGLPSLLFGVGLAFSADAAAITFICLPSLFLISMLVGLAIAWRKEGLGSAIILISILLSFLIGAMLPGTEGSLGFSMLSLGLAFIYMQLIHGSMPLAFRIVFLLISWVLPLVTALLFFISWLLRRKPLKKESQGEMSTDEKRIEN